MTGACRQKSNETQIELFGLKDKRHVWRKPGVPHHFLTGAAHGGGSIMLWRCYLAARTGRPIRAEGKKNAATYRHDNVLQRALDLEGSKLCAYFCFCSEMSCSSPPTELLTDPDRTYMHVSVLTAV